MNIISPKASIYGNLILGDNVRIDDFCILTGDIVIGNNVHIGAFSFLAGRYGIEIEDFAGLSTRVSILSASDDYLGWSMTNPTIPDQFKPTMKKGKVVLRRHSIIGAHSMIMPGVEVREGGAVGAMSFVDRDVEKWKVYAGVPAKEVGTRRRDILGLETQYLKWRDSQCQQKA